MSSIISEKNTGTMIDNVSTISQAVSRGRSQSTSERLGRRELSDRLLRRSYYLSPEDRAMIHGIYQAGMSPVELANIAGVTPETIRRRTRRLVKYIAGDLFSFILIHRGQWNPERRRVAELHFLQRHSLRETVKRSNLTMHVVRQHCDAILTLYEALQP